MSSRSPGHLRRPSSRGARSHLDERLREFLGLMVGDGCLMGEQETAIITLAPEEPPSPRRFRRTCTPSRPSSPSTAGRRANATSTSPQATVRIARLLACVVDELKQYAVLNEGSQNKRFTDAVFCLDRDSLAASSAACSPPTGRSRTTARSRSTSPSTAPRSNCSSKSSCLLLSFGIKSKLYREPPRRRA